MKKTKGLPYIVAALVLIIVGIITTAIIGAVKNNDSSSDIRAKAGVTNTLKLTGFVGSVDDINGTITVENVQFDEGSRSGPAHNYGTWTVTPPRTFSLFSAQSGKKITFTVTSAAELQRIVMLDKLNMQVSPMAFGYNVLALKISQVAPILPYLLMVLMLI